MATLPQPFLFDWQCVDAASDLDRLRLVLNAMPDEKLVAALESDRGRGRDEYPVRPSLEFDSGRHRLPAPPSVASLRRELCRNAELRFACGL